MSEAAQTGAAKIIRDLSERHSVSAWKTTPKTTDHKFCAA